MAATALTLDQKRSIDNYRRMGIELTLLADGTVEVVQKRLTNGYILTQKQLHERGQEVFPEAKILPVTYSLETNPIDANWIQTKMKDLGLESHDISKQLGIDVLSLDLIITEKQELSKSQKAAFFFYFLSYELNNDFREHISS